MRETTIRKIHGKVSFEPGVKERKGHGWYSGVEGDDAVVNKCN